MFTVAGSTLAGVGKVMTVPFLTIAKTASAASELWTWLVSILAVVACVASALEIILAGCFKESSLVVRPLDYIG
jgi:hypothetical protein